MLENRLILTATLGYIIGILWGLYCKHSIVLMFGVLYLTGLTIKGKNEKRKFKLFSFKRYFRYIKLIFTKKAIKIIIFFSIISNSVVLFQNQKFNNLYKNLENQDIFINAYVISNLINNEKYIIKVDNINGDIKYKNTRLYLYVSKFGKTKIKYGSKIEIYGKFQFGSTKSNYKGFDYNEYLKTLKIYGIIKSKEIKTVQENMVNKFYIYMNDVRLKIKTNIESSFNENNSNLLKSFIIGDKDEVDKDILYSFSKSNILHILAVSGLHVTYILSLSSIVFNLAIGKHYAKIITSIILILYMFITNFSISVVRAGICGILAVLSNFFYRKNDNWESLSISLLLILIYNPFLIKSLSLQLSFIGTVGIIGLVPIIRKSWELYKKRLNSKSIRKNKFFLIKLFKYSNTKIFKTIEVSLIVTLCATISVSPIIILNYNKLNLTNIVIGIIAVFLAGPIICLGFIFSIFSLINRVFIFQKINKTIILLLSLLLNGLIKISEYGEKLPLGQVNYITPGFIQILIYYIFIFCVFNILKINITKKPSNTQKRIKNIVSFLKYNFYKNKKKIISFIIFTFIMFLIYKAISKNLKIFFIDVGQGDSTLIVTPSNKKILIDGGGGQDNEFDVGKKILVPYLLDRKITKIDYIFISHFDSDHIGGIFTVMDELKVDTVFVSKQVELSENYEKLKKIVKEKNIKVSVVEQGDILKIDKNLYFDIFWPNNSNFVNENVLNNNSIVCKMYYKKFSIIFTGDIEEIAEKQILKEYNYNLEKFKSTVLKVSHHGSKTSSTEEFLRAISPKLALVGVGKNNTFGHPNEQVLKRLEENGVKVYRTDRDGEISIVVNKKGKIVKLQKFVK